MAGQGIRTWVPGEVITADNVQGYLQDQTIQVYADSTARASAVTGLVAEGMISYLKNTDVVEYYTGTSWASLQPSLFKAGTSGQYLKSSGTAGAAWDTLNANDFATTLTPKSSNYTLTAADKNTFITVSSAATITVPNVLAAGESVNFIQTGTGAITFSASGVTLYSKSGYLKTNGQYAGATIVCGTGGVYYLIGNLAA